MVVRPAVLAGRESPKQGNADAGNGDEDRQHDIGETRWPQLLLHEGAHKCMELLQASCHS